MSNHLPWRVSYGLQGRPLAIASQYLPLTHHPSCLTAGVKGRRLDDTIAYKLGGLVDKKYKRQEMVRTREYTGKNPALVGGFDQVNRSQRTRWYTKRLNRVLYGALKAMLVNLPSVAYQLTRQPLDLLITS